MNSNGNQTLHDKSLLLFRVGPFRFCVPATDVEAIVGMPAFRSVPKAPPSIQGVFSHRGQVATVINLRRKFGLEDHKDAADGQLIMAHISVGLAGFRVDEVMDIASSMEKDIIELTALKESTRFDQVLVLEDQIVQCTEFEQLYQAEDTPPRHEPTPVTDNLPEDAPPVIERETPRPDSAQEETGRAAIEIPGRISGAPDEEVPPEAAAKTVTGTPQGPLKRPGTSPFDLKTLAAGPAKTSSGKSPRQLRPLSTGNPATGNKTAGGIPSGRIVSRPPKENAFREENISWEPPKKRSGIPFAWILSLAAAGIALYLFWPNASEKRPPQSAPDISVAPVAVPTTSPPDNAQQYITQAPSSPGGSYVDENTAIDEDAAIPADIEKPSEALPADIAAEEIKTDSEASKGETSPLPQVDEAERPETPVNGEEPGTGTALSDTPEKPIGSKEAETGTASTEAPEKPIESKEPEAGTTSIEAPVPGEDASRFLTIETEKFTLSVEPGVSEEDKPSAESTITSSAPPPPAPSEDAETEYIHIVVKGDTLWDIAEKYLGDPFRYPQLAELSRIRDPDWIYPGDRVRIIIKNTPENGQ